MRWCAARLVVVLVLVAGCAWFGAGCAPLWQFKAVVFVPGSGGPRTVEEGVPVQHAHVSLECPPGDAPREYARNISLWSNADGRVYTAGEGWIEMACSIVVDAPGKQPRSYVVRDWCARRYDDLLCETVELKAAMR
jgi:hypothetical protein